MRMGWPLLGVLALVACSAPALSSDLADAEEAEHAGQYERALEHYTAALSSCGGEAQGRQRRQSCATAHLGRAELLDRLGRSREAAAAYEDIPIALAGDTTTAATALYRASRIYLRLGEDERAYTLLWRVVTDYPDEGSAADALRIVVRDGRRRNATELYRVLATLITPLATTGIGDNILYVMAELAESEIEDPGAALSLYDKLTVEHAQSGMRDDAYWHGARIARGLGQAQGAADRLEKLLATREVAIGAGSYNSVWFDNAQLELGRILRDDLKRPEQALAAFAALRKDYPASTLLDDALWESALTWSLLGESGKVCTALAKLAKDWPDSKYELGPAPELRRKHTCPSP